MNLYSNGIFFITINTIIVDIQTQLRLQYKLLTGHNLIVVLCGMKFGY